METVKTDPHAYRTTVWCITGGIAALAVAQGLGAVAMGSGAMLKDAFDWTYVIVLNGVSAFVHGRGDRAERLSSCLVAAVFVVGGLHTLYGIWDGLVHEAVEDEAGHVASAVLSVVAALGACAALARFRDDGNPLVQATWFSARNDAGITLLTGGAMLFLGSEGMRRVDLCMDIAMAGLCFRAAYATLASTLSLGRAMHAPQVRA